MDIFELRPLIVNFNCKLSAVSDFNQQRQLLCLVSEKNEIVLRYTSESFQNGVLKLINFFRRTNRVIHDLCFDPTGEWLLVLCFDNTLHIIPALAVVDKTLTNTTSAAQQKPKPYSISQVTSYIIPFVGPHECPNSKKCPNQYTENAKSTNAEGEKEVEHLLDNLKDLQIEKKKDEVGKANNSSEEEESNVFEESSACAEVNSFSHDLPSSMIANENNMHKKEENVDKSGNNQVMSSSFMISNTCPYPLSVMWWETMDGTNRAIIGYSDGSVCFVGLSPNCPFIASTSIDSSVMKLVICKDNTFESVMLLITSSLKVQYKLLLEQKAIKYVYPGDISPGASQARESDWQIVMAIKNSTHANNNSASSSTDLASDSSHCVEEDVPSRSSLATPIASVMQSNTRSFERPPYERPPPPSFTESQANMTMTSSMNHMPPPPPYSVAINRHLDNNSSITTMAGNGYSSYSVTSSGVRFQQQQMDFNREGAGVIPSTSSRILPAARARLSSLKSLGSKKLSAIKSRLYDNRQKMEEYIPGNNSSSFAIMDSPSLTPEIISNGSDSFFTLQNLRSTYLISSIYSQSNMLTVYLIDINLRPLFSYKIPKNCYNILISSNILYAIQYVDIKGDNVVAEHIGNGEEVNSSLIGNEDYNTEKENRDTDTEKQANYADAKLSEDENVFLDKKNEIPIQNKSEGESVGTSMTTSRESSSPTQTNMINAVSVISSAMASCGRNDMKSKPESLLALFRFENETVLKIFQMATFPKSTTEPASKEDKAKAFAHKDIRSPLDYVQFYTTVPENEQEFSLRQMEIMQNEFPKINYDPCYVITNKNVYYIQMKTEPFTIFLEAALANDWKQCREFCNIFDLSYEICIEFAGDYLLRRNKITQALLTYNSARVKPIRTALKLAMFGHTCALMHLCAMALKITYILKSQYFANPLIKTILNDITYRHSEDVRAILPKTAKSRSNDGNVNEGISCSDYTYGTDDILSNLQMSPSSQFHLANLLLITLAEKAVNDKNYIPLWNFLAMNTKYHTNMTSIVLCQSGLYSSALILAKVRGVWIDTFVALTSVIAQEFGWYTEMNVCLYNLSEPTFAEIITYMPHIAMDYLGFIQEKMDQIRLCVLKRLEQQLNPFSATLRPIVSHTQCNSTENNTKIFGFCKQLIETYLAVLIHMESHQSKREQISNALSTFRITYEDNQFAIESSRFKPISAGCAHCACVLDGVAYFWGANGVPCIYSINKSADPPEPPHAVKSLDIISQLDLEVHTVKCGRQHTLILTNNGLYAFGNNHQSQLGVGRHTQISLQPMLVEVLDGKNITILEAGQYHNAAVANDMLYTWGWGIYGQLGHGDSESVPTPKLVNFFKYKKIIQVSLGHAHSLVLCQRKGSNTTELYVFGSNHFGQLGIGTGSTTNEGNLGDEYSCANQTKSNVPIKLDVSTSRLRLIHTKFFTNLAVDEDGKLFTWGSSPQALRLANQIKRRANAKQKFEEQQKRDMSKQFESDLENSASNMNFADEIPTTTTTLTPATNDNADTTENVNEKEAPSEPNADKKSPNKNFNIEEIETENDTSILESNLIKTEMLDSVSNPSTITLEDDIENNTEDTMMETIEKCANSVEVELLETEEMTSSNQTEEIIPIIREPSLDDNAKDDQKNNETNEINETDESKPTPAVEVDPCEHMSPHLVDTSEVAGQILQISSGLFHFALISSTCTLYTWGKNLEHQLGTEDKERRAVNKPMPLDNIESPMYVDCGADFTLVMTTEYVVKAFGGNANGQCGRDLGPSIDKMKQRVVCLPTTKRLMRFESQCIEIPVEINLPRPGIHSNTVRYLKSLPRFQLHFVQEADLCFNEALNCAEQPSMSSQQYNLTSDNTRPESDDLISSLENFAVDSNDNSSYDATMSEHSYARFSTSMEYQNHMIIQENAHTNDTNDGALPRESSLQSTLTSANESSSRSEDESSEEELQKFRQYVHYCLYVFHGLYNPDRICEMKKERLEYRIRVNMLNFKFIEAFILCLEDCGTAHKALKVFEYYSKDTSFVPMRRQDLKYLIYYLMKHFLKRKFDMIECERFFLDDLDFYLIELAYVLYFNNNNTVLEQNLNQKFKNLIAQEETQNPQHQQEHILEDAVIHVIFDSLSVKFKTIVCQKIIRHCINN